MFRQEEKREITYRRFRTGFELNGFRIYERPCAVGIVFQREFLPHPVFLHQKRRFKNRRLTPVRHLHRLTQISSYTIGTEIQHRQMIQAITGQHPCKKNGIHGNHPLVALRNEARHKKTITHHRHGSQQQNEVLTERLPVRQQPGIPETAAVRHGVCQSQIKGQRRKDAHESQQKPTRKAAANAEKQVYAQAELRHGKQNGQQQGERFGNPCRHTESLEIVLKLILGTARIHHLYKTGENKGTGQNQPAQVHPGPPQPMDYFTHRILFLSVRTPHNSSCPYNWHPLPRTPTWHRPTSQSVWYGISSSVSDRYTN